MRKWMSYWSGEMDLLMRRISRNEQHIKRNVRAFRQKASSVGSAAERARNQISRRRKNSSPGRERAGSFVFCATATLVLRPVRAGQCCLQYFEHRLATRKTRYRRVGEIFKRSHSASRSFADYVRCQRRQARSDNRIAETI